MKVKKDEASVIITRIAQMFTNPTLIDYADRAAGRIVCPINDNYLLFLRKDHPPHE